MSVSYSGTATLPASAVTLTIDAPGNSITFRGADLGGQGISVRTPDIATSGSGSMTVGYTLATAQGELGRGNVTLPLRSDWIWGVDIRIDSLNPLFMCIGCMGSKSFPLAVQRTPRDSVWIVWGGNSISNPVIY